MAIFDFFKKKKTQEETTQEEITQEQSEILIDEEMDEPTLEEDELQDEAEETVYQEIDFAENAEQESDELEKPKKKTFFEKVLTGLDKTRKNILSGIETILKNFTVIDDEFFEELENALIMADLGVETTAKILDSVKDRTKIERITEVSKIKGLLIDEITKILEEGNSEFILKSPAILLIIGVNGVGKTTAIGRLAHKYKKDGKKVLLAAADTFRAAAIDQLEIWGKRSGVDTIKHQENSDPGAVIFDAIQAAKARKVDLLICDTAGRLQNKKNLMDELRKIYKIVSQNYPEAQLEVLLVLDSTTGQNAMHQAKVFNEVANITGIILTKLDGTAKGGIVISIKNELKVPVRFVGLGEGIDDIEPFEAKEFAKALFNEENISN